MKAAIIAVNPSGEPSEQTQAIFQSGEELLREYEFEVAVSGVVKMEKQAIVDKIQELAGQKNIDLLILAGGIGLSSEDVTPEATEEACTRMVPGVAEAMRAVSLTRMKAAVINRSTAGMCGDMMVIDVPYSPIALRGNLESVMPGVAFGLKYPSSAGPKPSPRSVN